MSKDAQEFSLQVSPKNSNKVLQWMLRAKHDKNKRNLRHQPAQYVPISKGLDDDEDTEIQLYTSSLLSPR